MTPDPDQPAPAADPRVLAHLDRLECEARLPHWPADARHAFREAHAWLCAALGVERPPVSDLAAPRPRRPLDSPPAPGDDPGHGPGLHGEDAAR